MNVIPLLSKTYVNWVTLTEHNLSSKFCQSLEQKLCLQTGQDLFKEVLWISVGQWAANLQSVKLSWMVQSSRTQTRAARIWFEYGWVAEFFSNLQLWKLVTLQHFDLQRPTVPLWKGLELVVNILAQETARILKISFTLLKWPNLHRVYFIRV